LSGSSDSKKDTPIGVSFFLNYLIDLLIIDLRDLATSLSHWGLGSREVAQAAND